MREFLAGLFLGGARDVTKPDLPAILERAATRARERGFAVLQLGAQAPARARELAQLHAAIAMQSARHGPIAPTAILSGDSVAPGSSPGRHAQFLWTLALSLDEHPLMWAYACGEASTAQGGPSSGVMLAPDTLLRARRLGKIPDASSAADAEQCFAALGDQLVLGNRAAQGCMLRVILVTQR